MILIGLRIIYWTFESYFRFQKVGYSIFRNINFHPNSTKGNNVIYKSYFCSNARNAWWTFVNFTAVTRSTKLWNLKNVKETLLFLGKEFLAFLLPLSIVHLLEILRDVNLRWWESFIWSNLWAYSITFHGIYSSSKVHTSFFTLFGFINFFRVNTLDIHFCTLFQAYEIFETYHFTPSLVLSVITFIYFYLSGTHRLALSAHKNSVPTPSSECHQNEGKYWPGYETYNVYKRI
jgi:hypothetical protein